MAAGAGVHGVEDGALNDFAAHGGDDQGVTLALRLLMMSRMSVCCSICSLDIWVEMSTRQYTVVGSFS